MAILGSLFALLGRFAGRFVNAVLGWATVLLFGRVEARRQTILGFIAMAALGWIAAIVGVLVPDAGTFLVALVPRPDFISEDLVRLGMIAAVVAIPLAIGVVGLWLAPARPRGAGAMTKDVLRGYPFTALLALMIVVLAVVALLRKINSLRRRWEDAHVPLLAQPGAYDRLVLSLAEAMSAAGVAVTPRAAPAALSLPPRLLERVSGSALGGMVPDRLMLLVGPDIEVLVYPSDLAISGTRAVLARARAAMGSRLPNAPAWQTMTKEAQEIENRIELARFAVMAGGPLPDGLLEEIDRRLAETVIPYAEWETLFRIRLQLERDAIHSGAEAARDVPTTPPAAASIHPQVARRWLDWLAAACVVVLLVLDILLTLRGGQEHQSRRAGRARRRP